MCIRDRLDGLLTADYASFEKFVSAYGFKAVSYTHLDVYKRQTHLLAHELIQFLEWEEAKLHFLKNPSLLVVLLKV